MNASDQTKESEHAKGQTPKTRRPGTEASDPGAKDRTAAPLSEKATVKDRRSIYEDSRRFRRPEEEDRTQWHLLAEQDMDTGRWTQHGYWKPFDMSPLADWKPKGQE